MNAEGAVGPSMLMEGRFAAQRMRAFRNAFFSVIPTGAASFAAQRRDQPEATGQKWKQALIYRLFGYHSAHGNDGQAEGPLNEHLD
jgi:hypothetical protein